MPWLLLVALGTVGIAAIALGIERLQNRAAQRRIDDRRAGAALAVVPLLERFHEDPDHWLAARRPRWPPFDSFHTLEDEDALVALQVVRRQWTQHRPGILVITDHRVFFDPELIKTNWSRTWPSITRCEAGPDHVRLETDSGDTMVFELDEEDLEQHPALLLAILDLAAARSAARIAALPKARS